MDGCTRFRQGRRKDPCKKADIKLARTGQGDADGDGISDCRESRILRTAVNDPDTDDDGLDDGEEIERFCHARKPDTDGDGVVDGDDGNPVVVQKVEALLDALTCPVPAPPETPDAPATPGSIGALGITAILDVETEFEHESCEDLTEQLALGQPIVVEIDILEDMLGTLTAIEVDVEKPHHHHGDRHDDDDDDRGEDDD